MYSKYIKSNIFPIIVESLFILACLFFRKYCIYINFLFYIALAVYFKQRKDFSIKEWLNSVKKDAFFGSKFCLQYCSALLLLHLQTSYLIYFHNLITE